MTRLIPHARKPGPSKDPAVRAKALAHRILDRLRKGGEVQSASLITWALTLTGDIRSPSDKEFLS